MPDSGKIARIVVRSLIIGRVVPEFGSGSVAEPLCPGSGADRIRIFGTSNRKRMSEQEYIIEFQNATVSDANIYAEELRNALLNTGPGIEVKKKPSKPGAQDFGATLLLILGTQAGAALAKGVTKAIGDWLKQRNSVKIKIKTAKGELVAENVTAADMTVLVNRFAKTLSGP
jgi:hypothetical protein